MISNEEIIEAVEKAIAHAEQIGDNWADMVDIALGEIGVEVDEKASRAADTNGYGPICVLTDGREIWQAEDTKEITIES